MNQIDIKGTVITWLAFFAIIGLFYWIWRAFSRLAGQHNKEKWQIGLLGVATFLTGVGIGALVESVLPPHALWGWLRILSGLLCCWVLYKFLSNRWKTE